jgi:hypothetical protein
MDSEVPWLDILQALTSAPFSTRNFTMLRQPFLEAIERMVLPLVSDIQMSMCEGSRWWNPQLALTSAPFSIRNFTISRRPC